MTTEPKPKRQSRTAKTASAAQAPVVNTPAEPEQPKADAVVEQPAQDQPAADSANSDADKTPSDDVGSKPDDQAAADKPAEPEQPKAPTPVVVAALKPVHAFEVTNHSDQRVFEPITRTSIEPGETKIIQCINASFKQRALSNLKQFQALGRNLELKDHASRT